MILKTLLLKFIIGHNFSTFGHMIRFRPNSVPDVQTATTSKKNQAQAQTQQTQEDKTALRMSTKADQTTNQEVNNESSENTKDNNTTTQQHIDPIANSSIVSDQPLLQQNAKIDLATSTVKKSNNQKTWWRRMGLPFLTNFRSGRV